MKINFDYLNVFREPFFFMVFTIRHALIRKHVSDDSHAILIVDTCLIGDFAASLPALSQYIARNHDRPIDLLVSPPLKPLAECVRGIRKVYTVRSIFNRAIENTEENQDLPKAYDTVLVLRMSLDAYRLLTEVTINQLKTGAAQYIRYGLHLAWYLLIGQTPRSWREVNFAMVNETPRTVQFNNLFSIPNLFSKRIQEFPVLATEQKKICIHTGASWHMNHWPIERWVTLLKKLHAHDDYRFIFVGAGKDAEDYNQISARLPFTTYSLINKINLVELLLVLQSSDYFIGTDSGPRNVAHLAELPSIVLLGPGPHMFTPPNPHDIVLDHSKGRGLFERFVASNTARYINRITPDEVYEAFIRLIS